MVTLPTRLVTSPALSASLLLGSLPPSAMCSAPILVRSKNRDTPAPIPLAVSIGFMIMCAPAFSGRAAAVPAALRNSPVLLVCSSVSSAPTSATRMRSISTPAASSLPKSDWIVNRPRRPWTGTVSSTRNRGPLSNDAGARSLALSVGTGSYVAWARTSAGEPPAKTTAALKISMRCAFIAGPPRVLHRRGSSHRYAKSRLRELRPHRVGEPPHRALDLVPRQHRALIEPANDLREPELVARRLQAVDDFRGVTEHALITAELVVRQVGHGLSDHLEAQQVLPVGVGKRGEDRLEVLVVLEHAGPHRIPRRLAGRSHVHRQHQRHLIALPRVAGGGEMGTIERRVFAELRERCGRRPRIDGQPPISDVREALRRVDGDPDRRVGPLNRLGHHLDVFHLVERAAIAEALARPRQADDLESLVEAGAILGDGHAKAVELAGDGAAADPEVEASPGQDVRGRGLFRAAERMMER